MQKTFRYYQDSINDALSSVDFFSKNCPSILEESIMYSLCAPGKRIRPILFLSSATLFGMNIEKILPIAVAIEMIHTYSLIHDDLPAIDNDTLRRGRKTNHIVFGENIALLAGDALLTEAFSYIFSAKIAPQKIVTIAQLFSSALGVSGIVGGQVLDIENKCTLTLEEIIRIHDMKTAFFISSCCEAGVLTKTNNTIKSKILAEYGRNLGHAFQIIDDILDKIGAEEKTGKTQGTDELLGKRTYPDIVGMTKAKEDAQKYIVSAQKCLTSLDFSSTLSEKREAFDLLQYLTEYISKKIS